MKKNVHVNYVAVLDDFGVLSVEFTSTEEEARAWQQFQSDIGAKVARVGKKELVFNEDDILINGFDARSELEDAVEDGTYAVEAQEALRLI